MDPLSCILSLSLSCLALGPTAGNHEIAAQLETAALAQAPDAVDPVAKPKAAEVLLLVQAFYDGTQDLEAKFKQTYHNPSFGSKTTTSGVLRLQKPGKMVWDYEGKSDPDFYADGKNLWVVEHDTRQVIRKSIEGENDLDAALKFLFGGQKLVREFKVKYADADKVARYGREAHHVLQLKPKSGSSHYKGMVLVVHATTGKVSAFVVYNNDGSTNSFDLSDVRTNTGIDAALFRFAVPKGYVESVEP